MPALTLYVDSNFISPYAMACFVALTEKQLPFELKPIDIDAGDHLLAPYRDLAPIGRVPMLVHGDGGQDVIVLNESSAIIEYLDELFPAPEYAPLLPGDVVQRAKARQVMAWIRSDLLALRAERTTVSVFIEPTSTPLTEAGQGAAERLIRIAERLIDGDHLFGAWSIADTDLALMLNRLVKNGDPVPERLAAYVRAQWQRPSVQAWLAKRPAATA